MQFRVRCEKCKTEFVTKGTEDWQSIGDGGPAACTGVELDEPQCPECGGDKVEILDSEPEDYDG